MKKLRDLFKKSKPAKNYYIVLVVSVLVIVLTLVFRKIYLNYVESLKLKICQKCKLPLDKSRKSKLCKR